MNRQAVYAAMGKLFALAPSPVAAEEANQKFTRETAIIYGRVMHASVSTPVNTYFFYSDFGSSGSSGFGSLQLLRRENLVETGRLYRSEMGVEAGYFHLTMFGVLFFKDCSPNVKITTTDDETSNTWNTWAT